MLSKEFMTRFGIALAPITVVLLDTIFVGPVSSNELASAFRSASATPFIAFVTAVFMGHWFHPYGKMKSFFGALDKGPWKYIIVAVSVVLVGVLSFALVNTKAVSDWFPFVMMLAGYMVGTIVWPVGQRVYPGSG